MNRNKRRLKAHHARKEREMFWHDQPDILPILPKGRVKSKGRAMGREFRNMDYRTGENITVENHCPLGRLNSTGTRVLSNKFRTMHTGRTWIRKHP